jgi:hypothetical protein
VGGQLSIAAAEQHSGEESTATKTMHGDDHIDMGEETRQRF